MEEIKKQIEASDFGTLLLREDYVLTVKVVKAGENSETLYNDMDVIEVTVANKEGKEMFGSIFFPRDILVLARG